MRVLAVNPGNTSTKIAVFDEDRPVLVTTVEHQDDALARFASIGDQLDYRVGLVREALGHAGLSAAEFDAVMGRGGLPGPLEGGTYTVSDATLADLRSPRAEHASNLGGQMARQLAGQAGAACVHCRPGSGGRADRRRPYQRGSGATQAVVQPRPQHEGDRTPGRGRPWLGLYEDPARRRAFGHRGLPVRPGGRLQGRAIDYADEHIGKTNTASEIVSADGKVGYGVSGARPPSTLTPKVRAAAEATRHHRGCSEIPELCDLERQGADLVGTRATTVKAMGGSQEYGPEVHGELYPKCPSCRRLFGFLGGK